MLNIFKSEFEIQIEKYEKDVEFIKEFARFSKKKRLRDITLQDLTGFYKQEIGTSPGEWYKISSIKKINKFLRYHGSPFILGMEEAVELTINGDIIESMKKVSKHNPTPKTRRNKRLVELKDKGWSYQDLCDEFGFRSRSTPREIYHREKNRELSTGIMA